MPTNSLLEAAYAPLPIDHDFYDKAALSTGRELVESFILPIRSGKAWRVPAGHVFRLSTPEGPQVTLRSPRVQYPNEPLSTLANFVRLGI